MHILVLVSFYFFVIFFFSSACLLSLPVLSSPFIIFSRSPLTCPNGQIQAFSKFPCQNKGLMDKYHIPQGVVLRYCSPEQIVTHRERREVIIPMIAFIEGGVTLSMGRITRDYLLNYRITFVAPRTQERARHETTTTHL